MENIQLISDIFGIKYLSEYRNPDIYANEYGELVLEVERPENETERKKREEIEQKNLKNRFKLREMKRKRELKEYMRLKKKYERKGLEVF